MTCQSVRFGPATKPQFQPTSFGDQNKKQMQSDAPITDMDANFLESWMWAKHPSLAAALELIDIDGAFALDAHGAH
jgi:hypothetical protein